MDKKLKNMNQNSLQCFKVSLDKDTDEMPRLHRKCPDLSVLRTQPSAPPHFSFRLNPSASPREAQPPPHEVGHSSFPDHLPIRGARVSGAAQLPSTLPRSSIRNGVSCEETALAPVPSLPLLVQPECRASFPPSAIHQVHESLEVLWRLSISPGSSTVLYW